MKLLIVTQTVDRTDPVLGFFHQWIEAFAARCEKVIVICLQEGEHALPENVTIYSLGKEHGRALRFQYAWRFLYHIWQLRHEYKSVLVHMNPEYVALGGVFWRMWHKKIVLWYTHRQVTLQLRVAVFFSHAVATAAPESLRIKSSKVHVIGHGVDVDMFSDIPRDGTFHTPIALVSVGRITPIKRLEIILTALSLVSKKGLQVHLRLVGSPVVPADHVYKEQLERQIQVLGLQECVSFYGPVPYQEMPTIYLNQDISINTAPTGGIDKAVLESMASGVVPIVTNRAFVPIMGTYASYGISASTPEALAMHIEVLASLSLGERAHLSLELTEAVRRHASLDTVINILLSFL